MAKKTSKQSRSVPPSKPEKSATAPRAPAGPSATSSVKAAGGEVRLYDAWKGGLPELAVPPPEKELADMQWWLVHFPSRLGVAVNGERIEGLRLLRKLEKGEDVNGLLTLFGGGKKNQARGRGRAGAKPEDGEDGEDGASGVSRRAKPAAGLRVRVNPAANFDQAMKSAFPNGFIVKEIARLLRAQKAVHDREGVVVDYVNDYVTQTNAVKLMIEHAQGRAAEKPPPPPDKKRVTYEQLVEQIQTSQAARLMLRRLIDEAEAAATPKPEAVAETPAGGDK